MLMTTVLEQKVPRLSLYVASVVSFAVIVRRLLRFSNRRTKTVPSHGERVLILGATSGVGRTLAHQYASRGARVCVVGRREENVKQVRQQCIDRSPWNGTPLESAVLGIRGDCTNGTDMISVRETLEKGRFSLLHPETPDMEE